ncbi:MAG TPA: hypothetical protein VK191_00450 [Symbiobacteriaceae bacterium]|nr:hypothetical protein [Symbiobacteriaceae bacterium]
MRRVIIWGLSILFLLGVTAVPVRATGSVTLEATFTSVSYGWAKVERYKDNGTMFAAEDYLSDGRNDQEGQRKTFFGGVAKPHSSRFLLYSAPGWSTGTKSVPVLLVHGANDNADRAWAAPNSGANCGASSCPSTGLMQYLDSQGYKVFAINFPHKHGDNYYWAEQIHDAIELIKSKTGATQVDVIAHSKGAFAARQYASSVKKSGGTVYGGSIRKLILLGGPNKGIDYTFRHGINPSVGTYPECLIGANSPAAHSSQMCYGILYSHPELTIFTTSSGNFFPGQKQMLYKWDDVYGLETTAQDWYTTYYGGWGYTSYSDGIAVAISQGSLVNTIRTAGIPATIKTYLYCGGAADIPNIANETTGPSDGLVFKSSCGETGGIGQVAGNLANNSLNHLELPWDSTAESQIVTWLAQ